MEQNPTPKDTITLIHDQIAVTRRSVFDHIIKEEAALAKLGEKIEEFSKKSDQSILKSDEDTKAVLVELRSLHKMIVLMVRLMSVLVSGAVAYLLIHRFL